MRLSAEAFAALETFLAIEVPLDRAAAALEAFASSAGLSLGAALANFSARVEAIAAQACRPTPSATTPPSAARSTITPASSSRFPPATARGRLAGGGRYDRLLTLLGAKTPIPGVGFSVWLDRIEALRGGAA